VVNLDRGLLFKEESSKDFQRLLLSRWEQEFSKVRKGRQYAYEVSTQVNSESVKVGVDLASDERSRSVKKSIKREEWQGLLDTTRKAAEALKKQKG
jgi:hypothetical protein